MELKDIKGLGKVSIEALNAEGITSVEELLYTFPTSYEIYDFNPDKVFTGEYVCINCVCDTKPVFIKYRTNVYSVIFYVIYQTYRMKCVFFSTDYLRYKLFKGTNIILYGKFKAAEREFFVERVFFDDFEQKIAVNYKLKSVKAYQMEKAVRYIQEVGYPIIETLPQSIIEKYRLLSMNSLVYTAHLPTSRADIHQLSRRRKYEEFFWYAMSFLFLRNMRSKKEKTKREIQMNLLEDFISSVGFPLTEGQSLAIKDCIRDIQSPFAMNRLVQGDVGCGKSIVAVYALFALVTAGYQGCLMVPTELLANQQYELVKRYLERFEVRVELLTSSTKKKDKKEILELLKDGKIHILVGTHSLLEDSVEFQKLGIAVIDEQHKFGVNQRKKLIEKYPDIDALYLTATPIPRTLGLTFFGDLDISSIRTMPKGRIPVNTKIIEYSRLKGLFHFIEKRVQENEQAYIVVPHVLENEDYDAISIAEAERIVREELPNIDIRAVHGRMAADKKNAIMKDFRKGICKVLLSTTVIEVGVNVPEATIMVLLDADRFGLAQIHQLRGRVGRGKKESYCALVTKHPQNERLKALEVLQDGFGIADEDFRLRGPGNYFGEEQSGFSSLEYADFETDIRIWECAKKDAEEYLPRFLNGEEKSIRFVRMILENEKNGYKSN